MSSLSGEKGLLYHPSIMTLREKATRVKKTQRSLATLSSEIKNSYLTKMAHDLWAARGVILLANRRDCQAMDRNSALFRRLQLTEEGLKEICQSVVELTRLPDPVGCVLKKVLLDRGLTLSKRTVPVGVLGAIFEARPDALVQIASLALKSGNGLLLKGGKEALYSHRALVEVIQESTQEAGEWIAQLESHQEVAEMLRLSDLVDLIIPRGSGALVSYIQQESLIPVLGHAEGVCHLYVGEHADLAMAEALVIDSKVQNVATCNAIETLLVHRSQAKLFLPLIAKTLKSHGVEIRGDALTCKQIEAHRANEEDWRREYLDYTLAIRVVETLDEAIEHINTYGSHHTDCIVTSDKRAAARFLQKVDSSSVVHNASTRFADGFRYGLGAEVGISTGKLHARGPVGLEGLVTYKWELKGEGHLVASYVGTKAKSFLHENLLQLPDPFLTSSENFQNDNSKEESL